MLFLILEVDEEYMLSYQLSVVQLSTKCKEECDGQQFIISCQKKPLNGLNVQRKLRKTKLIVIFIIIPYLPVFSDKNIRYKDTNR